MIWLLIHPVFVLLVDITTWDKLPARFRRVNTTHVYFFVQLLCVEICSYARTINSIPGRSLIRECVHKLGKSYFVELQNISSHCYWISSLHGENRIASR